MAPRTSASVAPCARRGSATGGDWTPNWPRRASVTTAFRTAGCCVSAPSPANDHLPYRKGAGNHAPTREQDRRQPHRTPLRDTHTVDSRPQRKDSDAHPPGDRLPRRTAGGRQTDRARATHTHRRRSVRQPLPTTRSPRRRRATTNERLPPERPKPHRPFLHRRMTKPACRPAGVTSTSARCAARSTCPRVSGTGWSGVVR
jgi:hypothetical protein